MGKTTIRMIATGCHWKHPHGRGEDLVSYYDKEIADRNTPTGVGKTGSHGTAAMSLEKHPHGRGEDSPKCR